MLPLKISGGQSKKSEPEQDRQTDATERITMPHLRTVTKRHNFHGHRPTTVTLGSNNIEEQVRSFCLVTRTKR